MQDTKQVLQQYLSPVRSPAGKRKKMTKKRKEAIVEGVRTLGSIVAAAKAYDVSPITVHGERRKDPDFDAAITEAQQDAFEMAEAELYRRGVLGYDKVVTRNGEEISRTTEYSDRALLAVLSAYSPEKYGSKGTLEVRGNGPNGEIQISETKTKLLSMLDIDPEEIEDGDYSEE